MLWGGGIPFTENIKVSKFQSFQVFEVSNFQISKKPRSFKDSRNAISYYFDRYWSNIQASPDFIKRIFRIVRFPFFKTFAHIYIFEVLGFLPIFCFKDASEIVLNYLQQVCVSRVDNNCFWETMKMSFRISPKWNRKVTNPKWTWIIIRSFRAYLFLKFTIKMSPPTPPPPDPKSGCFWKFPGFSIGNQIFSCYRYPWCIMNTHHAL